MRLPDENTVIGWLIMTPLIVLLWAVSGWVVYEIVSAMFW